MTTQATPWPASRRMGRLACIWLLSGLLWSPSGFTQPPAPSSASPDAAQVWMLDIQGAIGPASADLFVRSLAKAGEAGASLFLLRLDTPGGLDKAMRLMIQAILASPLPVATFVYPQGARAASAGTYLLYASHIAAMAPATNLGAATPVPLGGGAPPVPGRPSPGPGGDADEQDKSSKGEQPDAKPVPNDGKTAMERKAINDAVAYLRGLAELRGRNADWAEQAVRQAASLSAEAALEQGVIDRMAPDTAALLSQLHGQPVQLASGTLTLDLEPYQLVRIEPDWRHEFLALITDPNIAYLLLLIGVYGLLFEFYNPGLGGPGILGAVCLLLALYALQLLPVSYAGLGLLLLGLGLMVAEAMTPSFGLLGTGGVVAFVLGSILLLDTEVPGFQIALPMIAAFALASVLFLSLLLRMALQSRHQPVVSGLEGLVGTSAEALEDFTREGHVRAAGEIWRAQSDSPVKKGQILRVKAIDGLTLHLEALS